MIFSDQKIDGKTLIIQTENMVTNIAIYNEMSSYFYETLKRNVI